MSELGIRVSALIDNLFSFDKVRATIITSEVSDILMKDEPKANWDRMDGTRFSRLVSRALGTLETENPWLFR